MWLSLKRRLRFQSKLKEAASLRRLLGPRARAVLYQTEVGMLLCDVEDRIIAKELGSAGVWDREAVEYLKGLVHRESRVLVVGAHVGAITIPLARVARAVIAYEANPRTFELLRFNLALNEIENVKPFNFAAGDEIKDLEFWLSRVNSGGSKIRPRTATYNFTYDDPVAVTVGMMPIDHHLPDESFDLIVVDVEGAEVAALRGMRKLLKRAHYLHIEYLPGVLSNVSGTSDDEFLDAVGDSFQSVRVVGSDAEYPREKFKEVLREVRDSSGGADLTFSRRSPKPSSRPPQGIELQEAQ